MPTAVGGSKGRRPWGRPDPPPACPSRPTIRALGSPFPTWPSHVGTWGVFPWPSLPPPPWDGHRGLTRWRSPRPCTPHGEWGHHCRGGCAVSGAPSGACGEVNGAPLQRACGEQTGGAWGWTPSWPCGLSKLPGFLDVTWGPRPVTTVTVLVKDTKTPLPQCASVRLQDRVWVPGAEAPGVLTACTGRLSRRSASCAAGTPGRRNPARTVDALRRPPAAPPRPT